MITKQKSFTYEEYYLIEDGNRYEVINGELIMVPAPDLWHQKYSRKLEVKMVIHCEKLDLGEIFDAPCDVILDKNVVVQPDILFVKKENENILQKRGVFGTPNLIVEILSKSSVKIDKFEKFKLYEKYGVEEYWILDPENKSVEVFLLVDGRYELKSVSSDEGDIVKSYVIKDFEVGIKDIF
ncbi:MAG: Uma2 family endonuclease [Candidatus Sericytochromatia bacterium]